MSRLRVRLVLNEGGEGAPLGQIVDIGREIERFLRYLAEDTGIKIERRDWVARDFENASVRFDIAAPAPVDDEAVAKFNRNLEHVAAFTPEAQRLPDGIRHQTILQFAKAADALGAHEKLSLGLYRGDSEKPYEYRHLSKLKAVELQQKLTEKLKFVTTIQGTIHNIGIEESYFTLRERKSNRLIRCDFTPDLYDDVHTASGNPSALVYVRGQVSQRRVDQYIESMQARQIRAAPSVPDVYNRLFGKYPRYTGGLSSFEFVDQAWGADD